MNHINHQYKSGIFNHMSKFLIVTSSQNITNFHLALLQLFFTYGIFNVALICEQNSIIQTAIIKSVKMDISVMQREYLSDKIFPDKLIDLSGFAYRVVLFMQPPRVVIKNQGLKTLYNLFVMAAAQKQNSTSQFILIPKMTDLESYWLQRKMDLTLNTALVMNSDFPKLLTYEENGYCAAVPRPQKTSFFKVIFALPFDKLTWIWLLITFVVCVLVWRFYRNFGASDSHWTLAFGIFAFFIGQGINFREQNRLVLVILVQLIVFMIFVLSNGYQGVITSFLIEPSHEPRVKSYEEIFDGKLNKSST